MHVAASVDPENARDQNAVLSKHNLSESAQDPMNRATSPSNSRPPLTLSSQPSTHTLAARIRALEHREGSGCRLIRIQKYGQVFSYGEPADAVFLVESGLLKQVAPTLDGEEGLLDIFAPGDVLGESCMFGKVMRFETTIAMIDSTVLRIPHRSLLGALQRDMMSGLLLRHFLERSAAQRQLMAALLAVKKEDRLALTLLYIARKIGTCEKGSTCIEHRILQEELAGMTGTRRTRVGVFLQKFRQLGMIRTNERGQLVVEGGTIRRHLGHTIESE